MPIFTPSRRWQPGYKPFKHDGFGPRFRAGLEYVVKGPLFGCRMCGNCLLQETAFICPMECPKGLRNGPCGGSTPERCYVDETRPCIWYRIYERAFQMGREERLMEVLPPLDWEKVGTETWADVFAEADRLGKRKTIAGLLSREKRAETWESVFQPVRQPEWWRGDAAPHPAPEREPVSELERKLRAGEFVIAAEILPPQTVSTGKLIQNIETVRGCVTAVNFTDNASATPRMTSWACSKLALEHGAEPVMQIAARDRNRASLQAEVLGASALGVRNILCVTGDSPVLAPAPRGSMQINDLDSIQVLWILRRMRDEGRYLDGREIKFPPQYFLGAAASPFASNPRIQAMREHKKVNAGAQFFQTNVVFDLAGLETWLNELAKRDVLNRVYILVGITPLKSLKMAQHMREVPGVHLPERVLARMEKAEQAGNAQEEGAQIALELARGIRGFAGQGIHGLHIMPVGWEDVVPRIVCEAGLGT